MTIQLQQRAVCLDSADMTLGSNMSGCISIPNLPKRFSWFVNKIIRCFLIQFLHNSLWLCRKAKAIDCMVVDILQAADPVLKITDKIWDPRQFIKLDDTVLRRIEYFDFEALAKTGSDDVDESHILKAQGILQRLRKRDLYKYCGECIIPAAFVCVG